MQISGASSALAGLPAGCVFRLSAVLGRILQPHRLLHICICVLQVSARAKNRGLPQMGTLGAGNHYAEIQVVEEIYDAPAARKMGIDMEGRVCMTHHKHDSAS